MVNRESVLPISRMLGGVLHAQVSRSIRKGLVLALPKLIFTGPMLVNRESILPVSRVLGGVILARIASDEGKGIGFFRITSDPSHWSRPIGVGEKHAPPHLMRQPENMYIRTHGLLY